MGGDRFLRFWKAETHPFCGIEWNIELPGPHKSRLDVPSLIHLQRMSKPLILTLLISRCALLSLVVFPLHSHASPALPKVTVEVEEDVYSFSDANNGAGPMWCHGSTCLVRSGKRVFLTALDTLAEAQPVNNCRWRLLERQSSGWKEVFVDTQGRTREPAPVAITRNASVWVSSNPTLGTQPEPNGGPAKPVLFQFPLDHRGTYPMAPIQHFPAWSGSPSFTEHSYRSLAAEGRSGDLLLFQNIGYTHAEWTLLNGQGKGIQAGQLKWPWGAEYDTPQPIRVCYPNVAIQNRTVYFCGVSDIQEPYLAWREFKHQLTGQHWDYDFRRLFLTWTPDITREPFRPWKEIASCDKTCGWISPGDLCIDEQGIVHLLWMERQLDERLRARFFPQAKQSQSLHYAQLRDGKILLHRVVEQSTEEHPGVVAAGARFHRSANHRLFLIYHATGSDRNQDEVREIHRDGKISESVPVRLQFPFHQFYTATPRAGSAPSPWLDMVGIKASDPHTVRYARVRFD